MRAIPCMRSLTDGAAASCIWTVRSVPTSSSSAVRCVLTAAKMRCMASRNTTSLENLPKLQSCIASDKYDFVASPEHT